ncbi:MAG TPA: aspartate aminotransferase family protein [Vicinamibacteria bacterium]|nr:aspartate aminotransferase family protein [Vicinamibacteria bacterium]
MRIPEQGLTKQEVFARLDAYRAHDLESHDGRALAYLYESGRRDVDEVGKQALALFLSKNGLDPTVFPSLLRLENEVVAMAAAHLGGGPDAAGTFTSGGTESLILAVKTARDYARARRPEIRHPEMVLPATAHAAFHKAGHYLGVKPVLTPVDPVSFRADPEAMRRAITPRTILLVGSAVSYAHGVTDPIRELGELALAHDMLLHVDGCIGGFLLPYFRRLGAPVPDFDLAVPGVSSLSMDFHKYAYAPKGASVVLYRDAALRRHQFYACADWTGYAMVNATIQSTKSGGPLAATWAVLNLVGDSGYLELARQTLEATRAIAAGIESIPGLSLLGRPDASLLAVAGQDLSVFQVADEMRERGFYVQPQLARHGSPPSIRLSVTAASLCQAEALLSAFRASVAAVRAATTQDQATALWAAVEGLTSGGGSPEAFERLLALAGVTGGVLPERMATINELLNALPAEVTEELLLTFLNRLFSSKLEPNQ